jgi:ribonuclease BN (tRNA processing enzyme)
MKLKFLGTKGEIEEKTARHKFHSSLLLEDKGFRLLIDHGLKSEKLVSIKPNAILITHAHPDHFIWLKKDESYKGKIYLTAEAQKAAKFQKNFKIIKVNEWFKIGPFRILAYKVLHSLLAPAVGFKIKNSQTIIYNPDLVVAEDKDVLKDVDLYVGDGSSVKSNLVRRKGNKLFGHTRIQTQINWCKDYKIKKIIFTHLGKEALKIGDKKLEKSLAQEGLEIKIAHDSMVFELGH